MAKKDEQKKKRKLYERSKKFQYIWMTKLPWAKFVFDEEGEVQQVQCKVCTFVEGKHKPLATKFDNLLKHQGHQKAKVLMPNVDVGSSTSTTKKLHVQNECIYTANDRPSYLDQL
jgi:hypothetical protein